MLRTRHLDPARQRRGAGRAASWRVLTVMALVAAGLVGCRPPGEGLTVRASMSVSPQTALLDEPVAVSVRGLPAGTPTTVTAKATDRGGTTWEASARFQATPAGVVSLSQPSLGGSWTGVNPMVPLEYFTKALAVLRAQPGVDRRRLVVMGHSRGGEAALLLGAHFPELVDGVVANVPSSVVNPSGPDAVQPPWTLRGRPLPAVSSAEFGQADPPANPQAVIPVERIGGPVLLTCGALDLVWPSCAYLDAITTRLEAHRFGHPVTALRYPDAGHLLGGLTTWYGSLTDGALTTSGGTVEGTQAAQADAHAKLLAFLGAR